MLLYHSFRAAFIWLAMVLLVASSAVASLAKPQVEQLFIALGEGQWQKAEQIAHALDAGEPEAAFFAPFAQATAHIVTGRCAEGVPLAEQTLAIMPSFLPAYDLLAICLRRAGRSVTAAHLYRDLANGMDAGAERDLLLARANAVHPDMSLRYAIDMGVTPTTNVNRATYESKIGQFTISQQAQQKKGMLGHIAGTLEKPVFASDRLFSSLSLRLGTAYQSHDKSFFPFARIASRTQWALSKTATISGTGFYEYTLKGKQRYLDQTGFRLDFAKQMSQGFNLGFGGGITRYNYTDNDRDGLGVDASANLTKRLGKRDRLSFGVSADRQMREHKRFSYHQWRADAEWEHQLHNGFITSLGVGGALKQLKANATLSRERQKDQQLFLRVGLSHQKLIFKAVRPELAYTVTRQWSNDVFSRYIAHDVGIRFKAAF